MNASSRHRMGILGLAVLIAFPALGAADNTTVLMKDGRRAELQEFRVAGELLEGTLTSSQPWSAPLGQIDFLQTYMENFSTQRGEKGLYLARGKLLTFEEIQIRGEEASLQLSDGASVTVPVRAIDFQLTVIESRGQQAGASFRRSSGATRPSSVSTSGARPTSQTAHQQTGSRSQTLRRPGQGGGQGAQPPAQSGGIFDTARRNFQAPDPIDRRREAERNLEERGFEAGQGQTAEAAQENARNSRGGGNSGSGPGDGYPRRITRAEVVQKVDPIYDPSEVPEESRGLTALFEVTVGTSGTVTNVKVIKSTGKPTLDQAGVEAVQQYIYSPAENDGVPFESRRLERISFQRQ